MVKACNIFKDGDRWCLRDARGASAWSDSMDYLRRLAAGMGYEVSYRHPDAPVVLDSILCARLRDALSCTSRAGRTLGLAWAVAWLVERHPDLARLMLADATKVPA